MDFDAKLMGRGIEKIIISWNRTDIYTRLEVLLRLNLSGHIDALTETSNEVDLLCKRDEVQTKQQYRNALNKLQLKKYFQ